MVWRNFVKDGYKIGEGYKDNPLDLSNYLLLTSRMQLLTQNRVAGTIKNQDGMLAGLRNMMY